MVAPVQGGEQEDGLAGLYASCEEIGECRTRSVNLFADPKMRELKHYAKSHNHEQRLRANALLERRPRGDRAQTGSSAEAMAALTISLRTDGCENVNQHMKQLAAVKEPRLPS